MDQELLKVWPDWQIVEVLGKGSYGTVYKIENVHTHELAAFKVMHIPSEESEIKSMYASGMDHGTIRTYFEEATKRLTSEITIMEQLKSSVNVVSIDDYYVGENENGIGWTILIRMELLKNLSDYATEHKMTYQDIIQIGIDIGNALVCCEEKKIIHRDIKPANVLVSQDGVFKLSDFGIARQMEATTGASTQAGTENYMAPEIFRGEKYNNTVDIYSLGLMLYQLLNNGRMPFLPPYPEVIRPEDVIKARFLRIKGEEFKAPQNANEELSRIILKACAFNPEDRYQKAEEFVKDLQGVLAPQQEETTIEQLEQEIDKFQRDGNLEKLAESLEKYIELTNDHRLYKELADCYKENGEAEKAFEASEKYIHFLEESQENKTDDKISEEKKDVEEISEEHPAEPAKKLSRGIGSFKYVAFIAGAVAACIIILALLMGRGGVKKSNEKSIEMSDDLKEFTFMLDNKVYKLPFVFSDLEKDGWTIKDNEVHWNVGGLASEYMTKGGNEINVDVLNMSGDAKQLSKCKVYGITVVKDYLSDPSIFKIAKGITVSSSKEDIINAFGSPNTSDDKQSLEYKLDEYNESAYAKFDILKENTDICLKNFDKEMFDETKEDLPDYSSAPEYLSTYPAPTELGDSNTSQTVELDGDYYNIPAPVSSFINHGWGIIHDYESEFHFKGVEYISGEETDLVYLKKGNSNILVRIKNYANYTTSPENCVVCRIVGRDELKSPIMLPGKITIGSTKKDVDKWISGKYSFKEEDDRYSYSYKGKTGLIIEIAVDKKAKKVYFIAVENELKAD